MEKTISRRINRVLDFCNATGKFPWEWMPVDADDYFSHLVNVRGLVQETIRAYQSDISLFCDYATSDSYPWNESCRRMCGSSMSQIITDLNKARHTQEATMGPEKRAFDLEELQQLFDFADDEMARTIGSKVKGGLAAWRDVTALKLHTSVIMGSSVFAMGRQTKVLQRNNELSRRSLIGRPRPSLNGSKSDSPVSANR